MNQDVVDPALLSLNVGNQVTASNTQVRAYTAYLISNTDQAILGGGGGAQDSERIEKRCSTSCVEKVEDHSPETRNRASRSKKVSSSQTLDSLQVQAIPLQQDPGIRYTTEEDAKLCRLKQEGKRMQHIAEVLLRSVNSVSSRCKVLRDKGLMPPRIKKKEIPSVSARALDRASPLVIGLTFSSQFTSSSIAISPPPRSVSVGVVDSMDQEMSSTEYKAIELREQGLILPAHIPPSSTSSSDTSSTAPLSASAGRSYTAAQDAKICELFSVGKSNQIIANSLSRSRQAISGRISTLRNRGVLPRIRGTGCTPQVSGSTRHLSPSMAPPSLSKFVQSTDSTTQPLDPVAPSTRPVSVDHAPFSFEDDRLILQLHSALPGQFKKISRQMYPKRHKKEVRARYETLLAAKERSNSPESSSDDETSPRLDTRSNTFLPVAPYPSTSANNLIDSIVICPESKSGVEPALSQAAPDSCFASTSVTSFSSIQLSHQLSHFSQDSRPAVIATSFTPPKRRASVDFIRSSSPHKRRALGSMSNYSTLVLDSPDRPCLDYSQLLELAIETLEGYGEQGFQATSSDGRKSEQGKENEMI
ncbi:hypothetical protein JCM5353_001015 [Sporobolomyces roseus]